MYKKSLFVVAVLLISACAANYQSAYRYDGIHVVNDSAETLGNVTIEDNEYGRELSCGDIAPFGICSLRFNQRRYQQNPVRIGWSFGDAARQTQEVRFRIPITFVRSITLRGIISIAPDGSISTFAEQNTPP